MADTMKFEVLEDGQISIETEGISGVNHLSAEQFLEEVEELLGTKRVTKKLPGRKNVVVKSQHQH